MSGQEEDLVTSAPKNVTNRGRAVTQESFRELPARARAALEAGALIPVRVVEESPGHYAYPSPVLWGKSGPPTKAEWEENWPKWRPRPGYGVAIHLATAQAVLVDLDRKNGKDGVASYEKFIGRIPSTVTEVTPTDGLHLEFQWHPALASLGKNSHDNLLDGVDVKWGNQMAVCEPTVRPDGAYMVVDDTAERQSLPQALLDLLLRQGSAEAPAKRAISEIITSGSALGQRDIDLARLTFWMSHRHHRSGDGREKVLADARAWNAKNCRPPLDDSAVRYKVSRLFGPARRQAGDWDIFVSDANPWELTIMATRHGDKSVGFMMTARRGSGGTMNEIDATNVSVFCSGAWRHLGPQMHMRVDNSFFRGRLVKGWFDEIMGQLGIEGAGPITINEYGKIVLAVMSLLEDGGAEGESSVTVKDLLASERPREEWLIDGLVQKNVVNVLVANGGGFKTTLGCAMALAVGSGREISDGDIVVPTCQMPAFYYTAEDRASELHSRLAMLLMGRDADVTICDGITDEASLFHRIRQEEGDRTHEHFRVIDSVSAVFGDLNDNNRIVSFTRGLRLTAGTSLLDAHQSKGSIATGLGDPMGGIQWRNQARHVVHMVSPPAENERDKRTRVVTVEKHNGGLASVGDSMTIRLNVDPGRAMWFGLAEGQTAREILCAGIASGRRTTTELYSWAEDGYGTKPAALRKAKARLVDTGDIVEIERQLYLRHEADAMRLLGQD